LLLKRNLVILLIIAVLGGCAWLLLRPKPAPAPVMLHPTTRQVADTQKRLTGLEQAASKPGTSPRTLRLSENDLNVALAGSRPLQKLLASHGVQAVQIVLREPDSVIIHAAATVRGQTRNVQISGTLAPDPKTGLRFIASGAQVGSLPLPASVVTAEAGSLASHFARQLLRRRAFSVQSVLVQKKELVIVGIPTPLLPLPSASPQSASPGRH
jgi:hypothetical protein